MLSIVLFEKAAESKENSTNYNERVWSVTSCGRMGHFWNHHILDNYRFRTRAPQLSPFSGRICRKTWFKPSFAERWDSSSEWRTDGSQRDEHTDGVGGSHKPCSLDMNFKSRSVNEDPCGFLWLSMRNKCCQMIKNSKMWSKKLRSQEWICQWSCHCEESKAMIVLPMVLCSAIPEFCLWICKNSISPNWIFLFIVCVFQVHPLHQLIFPCKTHRWCKCQSEFAKQWGCFHRRAMKQFSHWCDLNSRHSSCVGTCAVLQELCAASKLGAKTQTVVMNWVWTWLKTCILWNQIKWIDKFVFQQQFNNFQRRPRKVVWTCPNMSNTWKTVVAAVTFLVCNTLGQMKHFGSSKCADWLIPTQFEFPLQLQQSKFLDQSAHSCPLFSNAAKVLSVFPLCDITNWLSTCLLHKQSIHATPNAVCGSSFGFFHSKIHDLWI